MPNYDFKCDICHHTFEKVVSSDVRVVRCTNGWCHGLAKRQPCAPQIRVGPRMDPRRMKGNDPVSGKGPKTIKDFL